MKRKELVDVRERTRSFDTQEVEGGHRLGSFSYHTGPSEDRASYDAAQPTTSVDPAWGLFLCGRPHRVHT